MSDTAGQKLEDQWSDCQKMWSETMAKMAQAGFAGCASPVSAETARQMRGAGLRVLAQTWDDFMRSPQFLQAMKQNMEQAIALRQLTNQWLSQTRRQMQAPSLDDLELVVMSLQRIEERVEKLSSQIQKLEQSSVSNGRPRVKPKSGKSQST